MDKITISTMITMMLTTLVKSINADFFWNTWNQKEEIPKEDITIDAYMAHTNTNMVLSVIKKILWSYYEAMKIFILINILEIIILISIIIAIAYAIRKIWKGRHGNDENDKEETLKQTNTAVYVNIANTSNTASGLGDNKNNNNSNGTVELRSIINRPETLENKEYISTWVKKMEIYLEAVDKQNWYKAAISFINIKLLQEIDTINIETKSIENNQENSNEVENYETLKKQLLSMIEKDKSVVIQKIIDFKAISERKQQENETIEEYGSNLIQMATQMFPNVNLDALDESLKNQFANGIFNSTLSERIKWKIIKQRRKNEKFNIKDAITYAKDQIEAYNLINQSKQEENDSISGKSENNSLTNRSVCAISSTNDKAETPSKQAPTSSKEENIINDTNNRYKNESLNNQINYNNNNRDYNYYNNNNRNNNNRFHINDRFDNSYNRNNYNRFNNNSHGYNGNFQMNHHPADVDFQDSQGRPSQTNIHSQQT